MAGNGKAMGSKWFKVQGYYVEEGGLVFAVSMDGRFATHGPTSQQALDRMGELLKGYVAMAKTYGFDPKQGIVPPKPAWELVPA